MFLEKFESDRLRIDSLTDNCFICSKNGMETSIRLMPIEAENSNDLVSVIRDEIIE
jgi:hypothetical protein